MRGDTYSGYGKPVLDLKDGTLVTNNVPIPKPSAFKIWFNRNQDALSNLVSIQLFQKIFPSRNAAKNVLDDNQLKEVSLKIFQDLSQINKKKESIVILVYLPTIKDSYSDSAGQWRQFVSLKARELNLLYIDLIPELRILDYQTIDRMFIKRSETEYPLGSGHYNEKGNAYIAKVLYDKLLAIPEVLEKMKEKRLDRGG